MPRGVFFRRRGLKRRYQVKSLATRFNQKYTVLPNGCWQWTGFIDKAGYGRINQGRRGGSILYAHVVSYEAVHGPTGDGLELDHTCRNRWCCNPNHLEAVTHKVNALRGRSPMILLHNAGVCKNGHPQGPGVTCYLKSGPRAGCAIYCLICRKAKRRAARGNASVAGVRGQDSGAVVTPEE